MRTNTRGGLSETGRSRVPEIVMSASAQDYDCLLVIADMIRGKSLYVRGGRPRTLCGCRSEHLMPSRKPGGQRGPSPAATRCPIMQH